MNPLVAIRIECLRLAIEARDKTSLTQDSITAAAGVFERHVRRGIRRTDLGGGCGCIGSDSADAQRKRQALLHEDARAAIDGRLESMTIAQLVTDADLVFAPQDAERIDRALARLSLRRGITGDALSAWVRTGKLAGSRKVYTP